MEYEPDDNYPKDWFCSPNDNKLKYKRVTFESLLAACQVGFNGVLIDNWTKPMLQSYLKTEGLNTVIIQMIYDSGLLQKIYIVIDKGTCTLSKERIQFTTRNRDNNRILSLMISYHNSGGYVIWILVIFRYNHIVSGRFHPS